VIYALAILVVILTLAVLSVPYRTSFLRERPFTHRGVEYPHATALAHQLGEASALAPAQAPPGLDWIADFFLAPVWLFWGDLRSRRPVNRLRRWRLDGTRPSGLAAFVQLGPDLVQLGLVIAAPSCKAVAGVALDQQEELRVLHPVGSERWQRGAAALTRLFALGALEVRGSATLTATFPLGVIDRAHLVDQLDALEAFGLAITA
jgi:hypothetical protein